MGKSGVHQLVSEDHGLFQTNLPVTRIYQIRNRALIEHLVDILEGNTVGHDVEQDGTTNRRLHYLAVFDQFIGVVPNHLPNPHFDICVKLDGAGFPGAFRFVNSAENGARTHRVRSFTRHVVEPEDNVLSRDDDGISVRR